MSTISSPSSVQVSWIDVNLEATLVGILLLGIYTAVYFGTVYTYLTQKSSQQWIIITAISLLYLLYVITEAISWFVTKRAFVSNGQTQEAIFVSLLADIPVWTTLVNEICLYTMAQIADGLLIWRCFNVWGRSFRVISLPLFLLFSEFVVDWTAIILLASEHLNPSLSQRTIINRLSGSILFLTFGTTLVTTLLISYRIHSVASQNVLRGSGARFRHIIDILLQSAALYAFVTLIAAILIFIPFPNNFFPLIEVVTYISAFQYFITGFAPTVMVARIAFTSDQDTDNTASAHISGLQFQNPSTIPDTSQSMILIERGEIQVLEEK